MVQGLPLRVKGLGFRTSVYGLGFKVCLFLPSSIQPRNNRMFNNIQYDNNPRLICADSLGFNVKGLGIRV
jgi:hypothetical protein